MCLENGGCGTGKKVKQRDKVPQDDFLILQMYSRFRSCVEKDIQYISSVTTGIHSSPPLAFLVRGKQGGRPGFLGPPGLRLNR